MAGHLFGIFIDTGACHGRVRNPYLNKGMEIGKIVSRSLAGGRNAAL